MSAKGVSEYIKELRAEIAELKVRNNDLAAAIGAWQSAHESDQLEIASLRAKLEAVEKR